MTGEIAVLGPGIESEPWLQGLARKCEKLALSFKVFDAWDQVPLAGAVLAVDLRKMPDPPPRPLRGRIIAALDQGRIALALFHYNRNDPGGWAPLLGKAGAVTASSAGPAYRLLDRFRSCVELPSSPPDAAGLIHAALIEALALRKFRPRPSVSVVIPVYNTPSEYLRSTIGSVLGQDDPDWELVLVDNGDETKTGPVIRERPDPRIRYFHGLGRRGVAMGRNLGNLLARGRFIAVMDHDDLCAPSRVRTIKATLARRPAYLYSDVVELFPGGKQGLKNLPDPDPDKMRRDTFIFNPGVAYPFPASPEFFYDPRFEPVDDYHLILACLRRGMRFRRVPEPLITYRWHASQYSKAAADRMLALAQGARYEDQYLRGGGDPGDRAARYQTTLLALLAHGRDHEAQELAQLGYGPEHLRRIALADPAGGDALQPAPGAEPEIWRQAAWLARRRSGDDRAAEILAEGLDRGPLEPRDRLDRSDLLLRAGSAASAAGELRRARHDQPGLALGFFHESLHAQWVRRLGPQGAKPPQSQLAGPGESGLSVIVALGGNNGQLPGTLDPLLRAEGVSEIIVIGPEASRLAPKFSSGPAIRAVTAEPASPGALWNQGLAQARGRCLAFLEPGDVWSEDFPARALAGLDRDPEAGAALGEVTTPSGQKLPGRPFGSSPLLRDERVLVCGLIWNRAALAKIGGFIPGLGPAAAWEFMVRAALNLLVLQPDLAAGRSAREPLLAAAEADPDPAVFREAHELNLLVKNIHRPLRYLDLEFSGTERTFLEQRLAALGRLLGRAPGLVPFLDPGEFLSESVTPYHFLYRLARKLLRRGLAPEARALVREALAERPLEPKLWALALRAGRK